MSIQRITDGIFIGLTLAGLEREAFKLLQNTTPDDVFLAIESDKPWVITDVNLNWARPAYKKFGRALDKYTSEYALEKLRLQRPELYSVITTHPNGPAWLQTRLAELRQQLES